MDPLNERNISPYKVESIRKALSLNAVDTNVATTADNTGVIKTNTQGIKNNTDSLKTDLALIHADLQTTNSLLQQLVNK